MTVVQAPERRARPYTGEVHDMGDDEALAQLTSLLDGTHLAPPDVLPTVVDDAAARMGWSARLYLIDYAQRCLVPLDINGADTPPSEDVDSTLAGRAFRTVQTVESHIGDQPRMWAPLLDGVERLGVIDLRFPVGVDVDSERIRDQIRWFSHLVGHLIAAKSPYGDKFHRARSGGQRSVASELVWSLLPPLTIACTGMVISGLLEPAERVAGDVFDYAVQDGVAHVAMFDATGHDLTSSVIGALALAAYRNGRRRSADLPAIAAHIDTTLLEFGADTFATGFLSELDLTTGTFRYVNAGHLAPLLLRGGKVVKSLDGGRRILLGYPNRTVVAAEEQLEPGDVVVIYTDGIVEARDSERDFFGLQRFVDILEHSAAEHQRAPETLRLVVHQVLEHQHGVLQDDASVVVVEWSADDAAELTAD
ncbi:MAG: Stage sporulation family protein [Ilumatobacteraceae bacterium]|nr:Stage sporulation family protein [Ilumatobacteraceae bacterium]